MRKSLRLLREDCWKLLSEMEKQVVSHSLVFDLVDDLSSELEEAGLIGCVLCEMGDGEFLTEDGMICEECCKKKFGSDKEKRADSSRTRTEA